MSGALSFDIQDGAQTSLPISGAPYFTGGVTLGSRVFGSSGVSAGVTTDNTAKQTSSAAPVATTAMAKTGEASAVPQLSGNSGVSGFDGDALAAVLNKWAPWLIGGVVAVMLLRALFARK